jgi:hypothetical protein
MKAAREICGRLFVNRNRQNDKDPDYYGSIIIGGQSLWTKGWIKEGPKGNVLALSMKPRDGKGKPEVAILSMGGRNV